MRVPVPDKFGRAKSLLVFGCAICDAAKTSIGTGHQRTNEDTMEYAEFRMVCREANEIELHTLAASVLKGMFETSDLLV